MGLHRIECPTCMEPHDWFSGSPDQRCEPCRGIKAKTHFYLNKSFAIKQHPDHERVRLLCTDKYVGTGKNTPNKLLNGEFATTAPLQVTCAPCLGLLIQRDEKRLQQLKENLNKLIPKPPV